MKRKSLWSVFVTTLIVGYASSARAQSCSVSGTAHFSVTVEAGSSSFSVVLEGASARALPPAFGNRSVVHVKDVLEFTAHANDLRYRPTASASAADGVVRLAEWALLHRVRAVGKLAVVDADLGGGVVIRGLRLACSSMTIDPLPDHPAALDPPQCSGAYWETLGQRWVVFRSLPNHGAQVNIELERPADGLIVCELERQGPWLRVAVADTVHVDAGRITGWVARSLFRKLPGSVCFTGGRSVPRPFGRGHGTLRVRGTGVYQGPARLAAGTPVLATQGGVQWATVRDSRAVVEVVTRKGREWVMVSKVPGVDGVAGHAWVRRAAVLSP